MFLATGYRKYMQRGKRTSWKNKHCFQISQQCCLSGSPLIYLFSYLFILDIDPLMILKYPRSQNFGRLSKTGQGNGEEEEVAALIV